MSTGNPFPDGKLPPMPRMEIDELTAKKISQTQVDQSLQFLWDERPDLVIGMAEGDIRPEVRRTEKLQKALDAVGRYLRNEVASRVGGYDPYAASDGLMWELRIRIRRTLGLPATEAEVNAARARGERVI